MAGKKGMKHRRPRTMKERDVYAASRIEQILDAAREGEVELSASRLKAIEIAYSRLKPSLASIEQTVADPRDQQDPMQLAARLAALFEEKPALFEQVMALKAAQQSALEPQKPQVTH